MAASPTSRSTHSGKGKASPGSEEAPLGVSRFGSGGSSLGDSAAGAGRLSL